MRLPSSHGERPLSLTRERSCRLDTQPDLDERSWHALVRIGDEVLALALDAVSEIAPPPRAARLPGAPPCVVGLGAWREQLLPIIAPHDLLGMKPFRQTPEARALIFCADGHDSSAGEPLCLLVDAVLGARQLHAAPGDGIVALRCAPITAGWSDDPQQSGAPRHARLDPNRLRAMLRRELLPTTHASVS
jgi:chemotaxis signal transduction protein